MRLISASGALLLANLVLPPGGPAQGVAEEPGILSAAVEHLLDVLRHNENIPNGVVVLDRRVLTARTSVTAGGAATVYEPRAERDIGVHAELRRRLSAIEGDFADAVACATASPRSCRLKEGVAVVAVSAPRRISEAATEVIVAARWTSDLEKMPVGWGRFSLVLERCGEEWRVASMRTLAIS